MAMHPYQKKQLMKLAIVVGIIILPLAGFFGGVAYQKSKAPANTSKVAGGSMVGPNGQRFNRQGFNVGTVSSVSSTSITITPRRNNGSKTFSITSSTQVLNGQQTGQVSDIKTGDSVLVQADPNNASQATRIIINPGFPGFGGGTGGSSTSNPPTSTQ